MLLYEPLIIIIFYLAHSDVTVFHSFKPKSAVIYELQQVMLHQPGRPMAVFSKKLVFQEKQHSMVDLYRLPYSV